jgi:DNA polymerase-3 subunit alpha
MKMMLWVSESAETETAASVVEVEEIKVVTKLTMASRKLKIKISNELLMELEKCRLTLS